MIDSFGPYLAAAVIALCVIEIIAICNRMWHAEEMDKHREFLAQRDTFLLSNAIGGITVTVEKAAAAAAAEEKL